MILLLLVFRKSKVARCFSAANATRLLGIGYYIRLLSYCNARDCTRLLDINLYAKTRTRGWFTAGLRSYARVLRKAVR